MKNPTLIFRVSNTCNLNCKYCYDKDNHMLKIDENKYIINNLDKICNSINKIFENRDIKSKVIFHGGEPLVINADTYKKLIEKLLEKNNNIRFSIQTNGTLLTKEHIDVFKKHNVHIGISLDGYNEEQNSCRVYNNGKNSFNTVMEKIKLLRENDVAYGVIMTLSKNIIGHEKQLYNFIADNKIRCNIRPAFATSKDDQYAMNDEQYICFFRNFFDIWLQDKDKIELTQIREIYEQFVKALNPRCKIGDCATSGNCFLNFISMDIKGELYSCNRTYKNNELYYGNIENITMEEIRNRMNEINQKRKLYIQGSKCKDCELYKECYGGCPANAFSKNETIMSVDNSLCKAKIQIRKYVKDKLEKINAIEEYNNFQKEKVENNG